jgi:hypothetical protein
MEYHQRRKNKIIDESNKENTSPEQCVIDGEVNDPALEESTQRSLILLETQSACLDEVPDDFAIEIRVRYGLDRPIDIWPKYLKDRSRYIVERTHRGRTIMLESIPIHRCLSRRDGYAQWVPSSNAYDIPSETSEHVDTCMMNESSMSDGTEDLVLSGSVSQFTANTDTTIDLTVNYMDDEFAEETKMVSSRSNPSNKPRNTPLFSSDLGHEDLPATKDLWTPLFDTNLPLSPQRTELPTQNRLASDPVSAILDELYEEDRLDVADFYSVDEHRVEREELLSVLRIPSAEDTQLFESISARSLSPIRAEDDRFATKRIVRKALLGQPEGLSSSQDMFNGYGIGFSAEKNPLEIVDHEGGTECTDSGADEEPEGFVNLKKAKELGQIGGLENYFNQFDAAPPKRRQSKSTPKSKPKRQWRGKNVRYKRKNK